MNRIAAAAGRRLARFLQAQGTGYWPIAVTPPARLRAALRPGDVLLVEGDRRISAAIKYLTHSTWSHAAFHLGDGILVEADVERGVILTTLEEYAGLNTRICRPVGLQEADLARLCAFMQGAVGRRYDLKNVLDLARYLLPQPPVPARFRRRMLALGSGDPTRAICSTLIAEAFQSIRYPILPERHPGARDPAAREALHIRHHSLFVPRDFDLSPYFRVVKPTVEAGFDYRALDIYEG